MQHDAAARRVECLDSARRLGRGARRPSEWAGERLLGATLAQLAIVLCGDPQLGVAAALAGAVAGSATDVKNVGRAVAAAVASGAGAVFLGAVQVAPALAAFPER